MQVVVVPLELEVSLQGWYHHLFNSSLKKDLNQQMQGILDSHSVNLFEENVGRPFLRKLGAKDAFIWISSAIGVFGSMACPMEYCVRIIMGTF